MKNYTFFELCPKGTLTRLAMAAAAETSPSAKRSGRGATTWDTASTTPAPMLVNVKKGTKEMGPPSVTVCII